MDLSHRTRRPLATVLAIILAAEAVSAVAFAAVTVAAPGAPVVHQLPADPPAGAVLSAETALAPAPALDQAPAIVAGGTSSRPLSAPRIVEPLDAPTPTVAPAPAVKPAPPARPAASTPKAPKAASSSGRSSVPAGPASYAGRNHVWIPTLGINRSVAAFPCSRTRPPDNLMYRWGCAGTNNVYLMGHAYGVMKPLHDAYVSGRLKVGMKAWYADGGGTVHVYAVTWWKLTRPTTAASWAWASQSAPSMTLQTCVGANSEYRLMVRLVEVAG